MNKEEIEQAKGHLEWLLDNGILASEDEPHIEKILKYIQHLEQKESILDKVTEYIENYIDDKQNEYEAISESYICQTDEDEYIKEKKLSIIKGQKQVLKNVLNIIEGGKK